MARDNPVTQDEVFRACLALLQHGTNITCQAVREKMGNRGSNTTILKYIRDWRESITEGRADSIPPALPAELLDPVQAFYNIAFEVARKEFKTARESIEDELESWKVRVGRTERDNEAIQARMMEGEHRIVALAEEKTRQADVLREEREAHSFVRDELLKVERDLDASVQLGKERDRAHETELAALAERIADNSTNFEKQLATLIGQVAAAEQRYEDQNKYWLKEVEKARQAEQKAEQRSTEIQEKAEVNSARFDRVANDLRDNLRTAEGSLKEARIEMKAAEAEARKTQERYMEMERRAVVAESKLDAMHAAEASRKEAATNQKTEDKAGKPAKRPK